MAYYKNDFEEVIGKYGKIQSSENRYASFDYCYNYFHPSSKIDITADMEKSCLVLGFYLASWGMYRGSSFILGKSSKIFVPLIEYISSQREHHCEVWEIDVDKYTDENIALLIEQYGNIRSIIIKNKNAHLTLVTKVMLGVFASTPAFDQYFIKSFGATFKGKSGFRSFNKKSLQCLNEFYLSNKEIIDSTSNDTKTICFESGEPSNLHYSKAKIIDMYGYTNRS